jgi:S-adenosylmethionine:tRNA ribosyltransferase-isomerase
MSSGVFVPYSYELPKERIAQRPCQPPESAKMLVIERSSGTLIDSTFSEIGAWLRTGDRLVFNDTKVVPARLFGRLDSPGGAQVELLLVEKVSESRWSCIGRPLRKVRSVGRVRFSDTLTADVVPNDGPLDRVTVEFSTTENTHISMAIAQHGTMPIPPYIRGGHGDEQDEKDYQSVFARYSGSIAAPTASLHFTTELVERLRQDPGVALSTITLHVGTASFLPIVEDGVITPPGKESFRIESHVLAEIRETRDAGGRIVAVGTTAVRALESSALSLEGATQLFIQPGYQFGIADVVVTNFHQPGTTHLLLVEALLGKELLQKAYTHALAHGYRFLSYGDGMVII